MRDVIRSGGFHVQTHRNTRLYFDLRLLGGSAEQDGWPDRNANRSSPVWNGNTFSHYRHPADKYNRTADTDHHAGCGTRHLTNSSWDINAAERAAANDTGARNPGNHAANEHYDSEHAGCSRSLHHGPHPKHGTEWSNRDEQWLESGTPVFIANAGRDHSKFGCQSNRPVLREFNGDSDSVSAGNRAHSFRWMPSGNGA